MNISSRSVSSGRYQKIYVEEGNATIESGLLDCNEVVKFADQLRFIANEISPLPPDSRDALIEQMGKALRKMKELAIWMSGSSDFALEGKARKGFEKMFRPTLDKADEALAAWEARNGAV
jgi:hypothetical protein